MCSQTNAKKNYLISAKIAVFNFHVLLSYFIKKFQYPSVSFFAVMFLIISFLPNWKRLKLDNFRKKV